MRISDWSSDVCSSDLRLRLGGGLYDDPAANGARCEADVPLPAALYHRHARDPRLSLSFRQPAGSDDHAVLHLERDRARRLFRLWPPARSEEHTSELQSLMRTSYAVFCLTKNIKRVKVKTIIIQT